MQMPSPSRLFFFLRLGGFVCDAQEHLEGEFSSVAVCGVGWFNTRVRINPCTVMRRRDAAGLRAIATHGLHAICRRVGSRGPLRFSRGDRRLNCPGGRWQRSRPNAHIRVHPCVRRLEPVIVGQTFDPCPARAITPGNRRPVQHSTGPRGQARACVRQVRAPSNNVGNADPIAVKVHQSKCSRARA